MTGMKHSDFNSSETGQTFSSLIKTNWLLLFSVLIFLCAVAIYCVFLSFANRYRTAARPRFNEARSITDRDCVDRVDIRDLSENTPLRRRLNFGTSDDTFNRRSNTLESPSLAGPRSTYVPALPKFSARNPEVYFQMIEFIFKEHAVTTERAKFTAVVTSLSHDQDTFEKVADIIRSPDPSRPYSVLKDSLIARSCSPAAIGLEAFFAAVQSPNETISDFMVRLKALFSPTYPTYKGPYKILLKSEKLFLLDYITHTDRVSIDRLKPAFLSLRKVLNASLSQSSSFSSSRLPTSESTQRVDAPRDNEADDYALSGDTLISEEHSTSGTPVVELTNFNAPRTSLKNTSQSQFRYFTRGRRLLTPKRLKDFCMV